MRINFYTLFILSLGLLLTLPIYADEDQQRYPKLVSVPDGFQPEGVVKGRGHTAYVGSLKTGGIYAVDLITAEGELLVENAPGPAVGLAYDRRTEYLYVAGGLEGTVTVYDTEDGEEKAVYQLSESDAFINDGIVTRNAVYFTDSFAPVIYSIPLSKKGRLPAPQDVKTIPLSGDFQFIAGEFNSNGIESARNGKELYLVNMVTGTLYNVDPNSGYAAQITISNGDVNSGDGLLLRGDKLYIVQNFLNQIAELEISEDGLSASITDIISDAEFRIPTTATAFGKAIYAINARFDVAPPPFPGSTPADPDLEYNLVRVDVSKRPNY